MGYTWIYRFTGVCMLALLTAGAASAHEISQQEATMRMHHLHLMMNHDLGMAVLFPRLPHSPYVRQIPGEKPAVARP